MSDLDDLAKATSSRAVVRRVDRPSPPLSVEHRVRFGPLGILLALLVLLGCVALGWWLFKEYRAESERQQLLERLRASQDMIRSGQTEEAAPAVRRSPVVKVRRNPVFEEPEGRAEPAPKRPPVETRPYDRVADALLITVTPVGEKQFEVEVTNRANRRIKAAQISVYDRSDLTAAQGLVIVESLAPGASIRGTVDAPIIHAVAKVSSGQFE